MVYQDKKNTSIPPQISFTGQLEDDNSIKSFLAEKTLKHCSNCFFRFIICNGIVSMIEHQKIINCLNESNDTKFMTRKWNIVNDQSHVNYDVDNETICNTEVLKSNLFDYSDVYILVKGDIVAIIFQLL